MLIPCIITRRIRTSFSSRFARLRRVEWLAIALAFPLIAPGLEARADAPAGSATSAQLSPAHAHLFSLARAWTTSFEPPSISSPDSAIELPDTSAVGVLIRRSGRLLASSTDTNPDSTMFRRAIGHALADSLGDPQVVALPKEMRETVGSLLTVQIELAHTFTPLVGRSLTQMCENVQPGIHGLAVRRNNRIAVVFPAQMLATGTADNPPQNLISLGLSLDLTLADLKNPSSLQNVSFYSFTCDSLAQSTPDSAPFYALRFTPRSPSVPCTTQSLSLFTSNLIDHLSKTISTDPSSPPLGLNGSYNPVNDQYVPLFAPPAEQAMTAFALARTASSSRLPKETSASALELALKVLHQLSVTQSPEPDPLADPAACAALVLASHTHHSIASDPALAAMLKSASDRVIASFSHDAGFIDESDPAHRVPIKSANTQSLIAYAQVMLLREHHAGLTADSVRAALDSAWKSTPINQSVAMLPWIGWAESDYAIITQQPLAHADDLQQTLAAIIAARITPSMTPGAVQPPLDVLAGLSLHSASAPSAAQFLADSQTTRPAAWLPEAILNPAMTPVQSQPTASASALETMAFICRLAVTNDSQGLIPHFDQAAGGIRSAPWAVDEPLSAQAMALFCAVEMLDLLASNPADAQ
ncbi:MAG TPA: hypothetical protein VG711_01075 [Phycisphaerales bacterium]|nr:hypothetical protein [Phycisphaerales bacterium]